MPDPGQWCPGDRGSGDPALERAPRPERCRRKQSVLVSSRAKRSCRRERSVLCRRERSVLCRRERSRATSCEEFVGAPSAALRGDTEKRVRTRSRRAPSSVLPNAALRSARGREEARTRTRPRTRPEMCRRKQSVLVSSRAKRSCRRERSVLCRRERSVLCRRERSRATSCEEFVGAPSAALRGCEEIDDRVSC